MRDLEDDLGGRYAGHQQYMVTYDSDAEKSRQWMVTVGTVGRPNSTRVLTRHRTKKAAMAEPRRRMDTGDSGLAFTKGMTNSKPL